MRTLTNFVQINLFRSLDVNQRLVKKKKKYLFGKIVEAL